MTTKKDGVGIKEPFFFEQCSSSYFGSFVKRMNGMKMNF
jgi:hypothetical protein